VVAQKEEQERHVLLLHTSMAIPSPIRRTRTNPPCLLTCTSIGFIDFYIFVGAFLVLPSFHFLSGWVGKSRVPPTRLPNTCTIQKVQDCDLSKNKNPGRKKKVNFV
jgi:hypothetical protein